MTNEISYPATTDPDDIGLEFEVGGVTKVYMGNGVWHNKSTGHHESRLDFQEATDDLDYAGDFDKGFVITKATDVGIYQGDAYKYVGSSPFSVSVAAGTIPSAPDFERVEPQRAHNSVSLLVKAGLRKNSLVPTKGYYEAGDGGGAWYLGVDAGNYTGVPDEQCDLTTSSGIIAKLVASDYVFAPSCGLVHQESPTNQQAVYDTIREYARKHTLNIKFGAGEFYLERLVKMQSIDQYGCGKPSTTVYATHRDPEPVGPYGMVEIESDRVDNSSIHSMRLVGRGAGAENQNQWAVYARAVRETGSDSGWWHSDIDVWAEEFKNGVWLRGGTTGSLDPIQFINLKESRFRRLPGGVSYRCTGQVNQIEGTNVLLACNPFTDTTGTGIEMGRDPSAGGSDERRPQGHTYSLMSVQSTDLSMDIQGCEGIKFETPYFEVANRVCRVEGNNANRGSFGVILKSPRFADVGKGATYVVTNISQTNPAVVTFVDQASLPDLREDDGMLINGVVGMTEVNGKRYRMKAVTATTFELYTAEGAAVDATGYGAYVSGGTFNNGYLINAVGFSDVKVEDPLFAGATVPTTTWFDFATGNYGLRSDGIVSVNVSAVVLAGRSYGQTRQQNNQGTINIGSRRSIRLQASNGVLSTINSSVNIGETVTFQVVAGVGATADLDETGNLILNGATTLSFNPGEFFTATAVDDNSSVVKYLVR